MEDLQEIIGANRVLELSFSSREGQIQTQLWDATLKQLEWDADEDDGDATEHILATAEIARVDLSGPWLDSLDAESASLEAVGGAFLRRERLSQVDEDSQFADGLVVIDYVEVPEDQRGSRVSHCLVWGVGRIFRNDIVALTPARMTSGESDDLVEDIVTFEGLCRHWERAGFVRIPDTDVMLLPIERR